MAYRDPYAEQYGRYDQEDAHEPGFNPYTNTQPHQTYDRDGYNTYGTGGDQEDTNYGQSMNRGGLALGSGHRKSESTPYYDRGAYAGAATGNRPGDMSRWNGYRDNLWTKGGRGPCIGRFCCCTLMITVFLIISILLPLALWTRPPNIIVGNVQATSNGSEIQPLSNGVKINLEIPIYVSNPNYFSVSLSSIKANIYYPINNTLIGQGEDNDITFHSHASTNFTFPFSIEYTTTMSSSAQIIADLETKCGIGGGTVSDITVDYDITLALHVLFFAVSPTISNSASFRCPLTASDLGGLASAILGGS